MSLLKCISALTVSEQHVVDTKVLKYLSNDQSTGDTLLDPKRLLRGPESQYSCVIYVVVLHSFIAR